MWCWAMQMDEIVQRECVSGEEIGNYLCDSNKKCFSYDQRVDPSWCSENVTQWDDH